MGLNRQDKAAVIEEMRGIVAEASAIVIAEYRGLTVEAVTKLRANARQQGVQLRVVKNTLVSCRRRNGVCRSGREVLRPARLRFLRRPRRRREGSCPVCQGKRQARYQGRRHAQQRPRR